MPAEALFQVNIRHVPLQSARTDKLHSVLGATGDSGRSLTALSRSQLLLTILHEFRESAGG